MSYERNRQPCRTNSIYVYNYNILTTDLMLKVIVRGFEERGGGLQALVDLNEELYQVVCSVGVDSHAFS